MEIVLIAAVADNGVIGAGGAIPWRLKTDLQRFKTMTMGKPVVMGRKTFISLRRPLPGVTLVCEPDDPPHLRVIDHGCGIELETQKRIFEPFFSLRRGGTGLGLFLSLNFVRHWGGDITVTSTPGGGSTFDVVLPAAAGVAAFRTA